MKILVFGYRYKAQNKAYTQEVFDKLRETGVETYVYADFYKEIEDQINLQSDVCLISNHKEFKEANLNFVLTLGGDGTILNAVTLVRDTNVPILGINLGRMGFLASVEKSLLSESIDKLLKGEYQIEKRSLLQLESDPGLFGEVPFALNDFALHKRDNSSMVIIHTYINGAFLNSYWADGLIVSTPTGSTGYSLSCGGPIIFPNSGNFVITPVAPHNLNVRPIVISDNSVISFEIEGRTENFLCTLDSRFETITAAHKLAVRKSEASIKLVLINDITFLKTIHEKLSWGYDTRN